VKTVFSYIKPYKWPFIVAFFFMLTELGVELVQPLLIAKIIDEGIMEQNQQIVLIWGCVMMALAFFAFLSGVINSYFASHVAQSFSFDIRQALFRKIQSFTMETFTKFPTAGLITRMTSDITVVQHTVYMCLRIMMRAPLLVLGSMVMSFVVNPKLAIWLTIGAPFLLIFLYFTVRKGINSFSSVQKRLDRLNRVIQENLQAVRLVKAYLRGTYESKRFDKIAGILKVDTVSALRLMETILPILLLVLNVSLLVVLWFGASQIQTGDAQVGELVAIVNYAMRMTGSFSMFAFIIMAFSRSKASAERMEEVLKAEGVEDTWNREASEGGVGEVEFEGVSFTYPNTDLPVLKDISFKLKPGEKLAIMGATGSGKSTLLSLIPRFFESAEGRVLVDGKDVKEWPLKQLRERIGFVPQQSVLFTGTILENLSWGKKGATEEELIEAAKKAQIHHSIIHFPKGYETRVGQKGVNLSGGQKQRLSIARALVRMPSILILDDSTSALDVKTESALWDALGDEKATMLVVTQKIRTAKEADRILLLQDGRISSYGTHEALLKNSELYRQIAESQNEEEVARHASRNP